MSLPSPRAIAIALLLAASVVVGGSAEAALTPDQARAVYASLAKRFPKRKVFYRWQSRTSGLNLVRAETFTGKIYDYFMDMPFNSNTMHGGRGLYVAETLYTSSRFIRGNAEGSLIEVVIDEGTPFIDLEDPATMEKLKAAGLTGSPRELGELEPKYVIRYRQSDVNRTMRDWWVIKSPRGVHLQRFNPNRFTNEELRDIYDKIGKYGDSDDVRVARQVLVSRLTDEQRSALGWKKTYFYKIDDVIKFAVDPVVAGRAPTSEDMRFFNEFLERMEEVADSYAGRNLAGSRIFEHPKWTSETLRKFLASIFKPNRSVRQDWVRNWFDLLKKNRSVLVPVLSANPELSRNMIEILYLGSSSYRSERNRSFSNFVKNQGAEGLEDLMAYYVPKRGGTEAELVDLAQTLWLGLGEREFRNFAEPVLVKRVGDFRYSSDQLKILQPLFPATLSGVQAIDVPPANLDPKRFDRLFAEVDELLKSGDFYASERRSVIERFFPLSPGGSDLKKLEYRANTRAFAEELRNAAFRQSKSAAEFISFTGSAFDPGNEAYRTILDEAVQKNIDAFFALNPTEDEMIALLKAMQYSKGTPYRVVADRCVNRVKDPQRFAERLGNLECLRWLRKP
ncbi:MAG: hypothetical protein JST04_16110 [Bdellovibrionales bacterium]|nr:hypothetical protein [Bdellovibrionales bacterium]